MPHRHRENAYLPTVAPPGAEISESESEFRSMAIIAEADCLLHLDVNDVYVNSAEFRLRSLCLPARPAARAHLLHPRRRALRRGGRPADRYAWRSGMIDPVWALLTAAYERIGCPVPTCLERDFNIPDLAALSAEVGHISPHLQAQAAGRQKAGGVMPAAFQAFQREFGRYLRDPHHVARPPGLPARQGGHLPRPGLQQPVRLRRYLLPGVPQPARRAPLAPPVPCLPAQLAAAVTVVARRPMNSCATSAQPDIAEPLPRWLAELSALRVGRTGGERQRCAHSSLRPGRRSAGTPGRPQSGPDEPGLRLAGAAHGPRLPAPPAAADASGGLSRCRRPPCALAK